MENTWDIFIAGGGVGGVAAALRASAMGCSVILTDENEWLGGQITSQGVSALDEHSLINTFGGTSLYNDFRERIKKYYSRNYKLSVKGKNAVNFNPGSSGKQRRLAFEPIAGMRVIEDMFAPAVKSGKVTILKPAKVVGVDKDKSSISDVMVEDLQTGKKTKISATMVIDATELGDLLPLAGIPYRTGVESFAETHEPSAPEESIPDACQAINYTFALEKRPGSQNIIPKPALYEKMKKKYAFSMGGMKMFDDSAGVALWKYRRIIDAANFDDPAIPYDVTLINCNSTDFREDSIIDKKSGVVNQYLYQAKQIALSYLYWLQTEAPREDGGKGYPEFELRADLMGTEDGLAQHPYIRESRRIKSLHMMKEEDISAYFSPDNNRARLFHDAIGIGWYISIDIHYCCHTDKRYGSGQRLLPYQIPMGTILTDSVSNFIAGAKNIGTTHITNGALRLHPVEWNIGESAGALAAYAIKINKTPNQIYSDKKMLRIFQLKLLAQGIPLFWFDDVPLTHDSFMHIQYLALKGVIIGSASHLHFYPDDSISRVTATQWMYRAKIRYGLNTEMIEKLEKKIPKLTRAHFAKALFKAIFND